MTVVRGVDGCKGGWLCVSMDLESGKVAARVFPADARELLSEDAAVTAIDIPIGLASSGPRACDIAARKLLGPRGSSVFPAPVRAALSAKSYEAACRASEKACGKRLSLQTYGILPKIRSIDILLRNTPDLLATVREVHPELSFYYWNGRKPLLHSKKTSPGLKKRWALVETIYRGAPDEVRATVPRQQAADDDILDAFATLWTAERILDGSAEPVTEHDERDERGLPMQIWA